MNHGSELRVSSRPTRIGVETITMFSLISYNPVISRLQRPKYTVMRVRNAWIVLRADGLCTRGPITSVQRLLITQSRIQRWRRKFDEIRILRAQKAMIHVCLKFVYDAQKLTCALVSKRVRCFYRVVFQFTSYRSAKFDLNQAPSDLECLIAILSCAGEGTGRGLTCTSSANCW